MLKNRSVPVDTLIPHVFYQNLEDAIAWLTRTFGFKESFRYGDPISGAQLHLGNAWMMVSEVREGRSSPAQLGSATQFLTVFVDDVEEHFARTKSAGVEIVEDLHETVYGELQYAAKDLEGHLWIFSRHARDLSPEDWGATIAR